MPGEHTERLRPMLEEMSSVDVMSVDSHSVREISDIRIDKRQSVDKRVLSLVEQTGNPYIYKDGNIIVKISFANNGKSLQSCMEDYLAAEVLMNRPY